MLQLSHRNIVSLYYGYFCDKMKKYILMMEFCDKGTLSKVLKVKGEIEETEAMSYFV